MNLTHNQLARLFLAQPSHPAFSVESLDLRDNVIDDIFYTVGEEITRFLPNVKDLKINLYDEEHVDFIMKAMPQLQFLNGLPVERDDEDNSSPDKATYSLEATEDIGRAPSRRINELSEIEPPTHEP